MTSSYAAPAAQNTLQLQDSFCMGIGEGQIFSVGQVLNTFAHVLDHLPLLRAVLTTCTDT